MKNRELKFAVEYGKYGNGRTALQIVEEKTGIIVSTASVNIPQAPCPKGSVWIKNWGENEGIAEMLIDNGIISEPIGEYRVSPYAVSTLHILLEQTAFGKEDGVRKLITSSTSEKVGCGKDCNCKKESQEEDLSEMVDNLLASIFGMNETVPKKEGKVGKSLKNICEMIEETGVLECNEDDCEGCEYGMPCVLEDDSICDLMYDIYYSVKNIYKDPFPI